MYAYVGLYVCVYVSDGRVGIENYTVRGYAQNYGELIFWEFHIIWDFRDANFYCKNKNYTPSGKTLNPRGHVLEYIVNGYQVRLDSKSQVYESKHMGRFSDESLSLCVCELCVCVWSLRGLRSERWPERCSLRCSHRRGSSDKLNSTTWSVFVVLGLPVDLFLFSVLCSHLPKMHTQNTCTHTHTHTHTLSGTPTKALTKKHQWMMPKPQSKTIIT